MLKNERPILIKEYDPSWPGQFESIRQQILNIGGVWLKGVEHIGSTAIPGLAAKPTIDIMLGLDNAASVNFCIQAMVGLGYTYLPGYFWPLPGRFDMVYMDVEGERFVNAHLVEFSGVFWRRHLLFRDYLRQHPEVANQYQQLKMTLSQRYSPDVDAYSMAKSDFIVAVMSKAGWKED